MALPLLLCLAAVASAAEEEILPRCGIRYPGGFDPRTLTLAAGTVSALELPARGPVRFRLEGEGERYVVLASPSWFWREIGASLADGDRAEVLGSKALGRDGELYLVAQEIDPGDGEGAWVIRDSRGAPEWTRCAPGACGRRRGGGVPGGGRGMMMRRGRR